MQIRDFDYTPQDYETVVQIINTVWPDYPVTPDELCNEDEEYKPGYVRRRFLAIKDELVVGCGAFEHRLNMYHPQLFWLRLDVLPAHRQQGIGTRLYEHMLTLLKSDYGACELHSNIRNGQAYSIRFLHERGFQEIKREVETRLDTATFDPTTFHEIDEQLAASGIEIYVLSELLISDVNTLHNVYELHQTLLQEVPSPAQRTKVNFESWRWGYSSAYPRFIPDANFMALHQGAYIGLSSLWGDPTSGQLTTGMTGVLPAYRRKGIATALKVRGIRFAQTQGNLSLMTSNESENPMLQLNLNLGFKPYADETLLVKYL